MEGVASEASSLAGTSAREADRRLRRQRDLHRWTDSLPFSEDVGKRYESYGWHVLRVDDGNDLEALDGAFTGCETKTERPSLISVRTHIGFGSPNKQDTAASHGRPSGPDEVEATEEPWAGPRNRPFMSPTRLGLRFEKAANAESNAVRNGAR